MEYIAFKDLLDDFAPANSEIPAAMLRQLAQLDRNGNEAGGHGYGKIPYSTKNGVAQLLNRKKWSWMGSQKS